jgi:hypothetical protein
MERRYLVATLALVATFSIFSREFRPGDLAKLPRTRAELIADLHCARQYVAEKVMAQLQPLVGPTAPEEAQMVAELNLPEVARNVLTRVQTQAHAQIARQAAQQKCDVTLRMQRDALRAQEAAQRAVDIRIRAAEQGQRINDLAVIRAQELSERAAERAQQINITAAIRAQELAERSVERTQCALEKSYSKMARTQLQGMPIHISFQVPATPQIHIVVPAIPQPPTPASF